MFLRNLATDAQLTALRKEAFVSSLSWVEEEGTARYIGGEQNRLVRSLTALGSSIDRRSLILIVIECDAPAVESYLHPCRGHHGSFLRPKYPATGVC